ncbi:MAG: molybdenum cofactor biosynthesis protein MoaE [Bacteroidia bacterium]|jgi:molybdopterin synthase catalytic subunit
MTEKKKPNVFVEGAINPQFIADSIAKHSSKKGIGAHDIFLGQVRNDVLGDKEVKAIEYSTYQPMAEDILLEIREAAFREYNLVCMHIYHSIGRVDAGEICLFVFVSSKHRKDAFEACRSIVEKIKADVPIWGKEIFEDETSAWKENR